MGAEDTAPSEDWLRDPGQATAKSALRRLLCKVDIERWLSHSGFLRVEGANACEGGGRADTQRSCSMIVGHHYSRVVKHGEIGPCPWGKKFTESREWTGRVVERQQGGKKPNGEDGEGGQRVRRP